MNSQLWILLGLCAFIGGGAAIRCYKCQRWQAGFLNGGEHEDECRDPETEKTPQSDDECGACQMDTRDGFFDWVERKCVTNKDDCKTGTITKSFIDLGVLDDETEYKVQRKCCTEELCNNAKFTGSSAADMRTSYFLFAAVLFAGLVLR